MSCDKIIYRKEAYDGECDMWMNMLKENQTKFAYIVLIRQ